MVTSSSSLEVGLVIFLEDLVVGAKKLLVPGRYVLIAESMETDLVVESG